MTLFSFRCLRLNRLFLALVAKEVSATKQIEDAEKDLDKQIIYKYNSLGKEEIKLLVVENKWLNYLHDSVKNELERISQRLAGRIKELAERYETPLAGIAQEAEELSKKVDNHLKSMGFKW